MKLCQPPPFFNFADQMFQWDCQRMMAQQKNKEKPAKGFVSEQGSASYYFTWTVALGIYALMFYGIAKHAAGN